MINEHTQAADVLSVLADLQSGDNSTIRSAAFIAGDLGMRDALDSLCEHIKSTNVGVQEAAEYALRKIRGKLTIQKMLPLLRCDETSLRNIAMDVLREIGCDDINSIQPFLRDQDPDMRIFVADILGHTKSRKAVPLLCEALLKDPEVNVRYQAAMSLGNLAFPEAADALHQAMHDEEWVQFSVVEALTRIGADSTINALVQSLSSSSPLVASVIIDALGEMKNIKAVPLLLKFLEKTSTVLRHKTVKAIVLILGGSSLSLLSSKEQARFKEYLDDALGDEEESIQRAALLGLSVVGDGFSSKTIMDFVVKIHRPDEDDRYDACVKTLASIGYNESFYDFFQSEDPRVLLAAVSACTHMNTHLCVEPLTKVFWRMERDTQRIASQYLASNAQVSDVPFILDILEKHHDGEILRNALQCLGEHLKYVQEQDKIYTFISHPMPDVKEAALLACIHLNTPELSQRFKQLFYDGDEQGRMFAVYALSHINIQSNMQYVVAALEDESSLVRQLAVESFSQLGFSLHQHVHYLLPKLHDPAHEVRSALIDVLGASGDCSVTPHIVNALDDENEWVCIRAVEALGILKADSAIPRLLSIIENVSPMVTLKIIDTLAEIGGNIVFRALLDMMHHENFELQQAATEAIAKIKAERE